jgi:hypothetical protein
MSKQTVVDLIFDNFNLLSDVDFKSWMLNKYDELKAMEKEQIKDAYQLGFEDGDSNVSIYFDKKEYYNQTYGGDK